MSEPNSTADASGPVSREELMSAMFASLVLQQANMALMFLGKVPHPETGKEIRDLDAARMFIDNLEMLELKTKGNLSKEEENLVKQSLMNTRMAFVEAANKPPAQPAKTPAAAAAPKPTETSPATDAGQPKAAGEAPSPTPAPDAAEERKKFVKKY